jgi:hypothetical protein
MEFSTLNILVLNSSFTGKPVLLKSSPRFNQTFNWPQVIEMVEGS